MAQRVTNGMMINTFNNNLFKNTAKMERYQAQLSTNRKIVRLSDDPVGIIKSVNARVKLADIEQFNKNVDDARAWMTSTETALSEMNTVIKRAYELTVQAANDTNGPDDLEAISHEIAQLRGHIIQIGNTTLGDKFIFGGYNATRQPFDVSNPDADPPVPLSLDDDKMTVWFNGSQDNDGFRDMIYDDTDFVYEADTVVNYEIGFGIYMDIGVGGATMMGVGEENLFKILNDLTDLLRGIDGDGDEIVPGNTEIQPFIEKFQKAQNSILATMADLGGRQNRLDLISDRYSQDFINYTKMKSDVEDLDQAEAIMHFSMAEAVYRAALSVGARIIQPTLVDFLR